MSIGRRIKKIKEKLNLTSTELAQTLSIPVRTIGSYERDEAQPGPKFLNALIEGYNVNINWLLSGKGNMFIDVKNEVDVGFVSKIQERLNLDDEQMRGLIEILDSDASRDMVLKFIEVKHGNKDALNILINNLEGIKAIYS